MALSSMPGCRERTSSVSTAGKPYSGTDSIGAAANFQLTDQHGTRVQLSDFRDQVVFLAVNVNAAANAVSDVANATQVWHLDELLNWHFLTGSLEELRPVWKAYAVEALAMPGSPMDITHTPGVFVIDQSGNKRWYIPCPSTTLNGAVPN